MNSDRWQQVDELFDAVLELPINEREKFLTDKCNGDEELCLEVLSLLKAYKKADVFMESPAMEVAAKNIAQENTFVEHASLVGREIGSYMIERLLGIGGMGEVYLAYDAKLGRKVALKILPAQFVTDTDRIRRFEREARAVSSLNHPNLITIYDIGKSDASNFIATEFVEGQTVRELINKRMNMRDAVMIAMQVAEALSAVHNEKIIHRDIKPENIMVRPDGYVKVLDFGLAKLIEPIAKELNNSLSKTQQGVVMGTLSYMSPEQATGEAVDHRTDIWSLGVVLYEMATGIAPFKGANRQETLNAILTKEPSVASDSNPTLHLELDYILGKALEKDKDFRYQTTSDFRADLKRLLRTIDSGATVSGERPLTTKKQNNATTEQLSPKRRFVFLSLVMAGVILIALTSFFVWRFFKKAETVPDWTRATNIQLTNQVGTEYFPNFSPDGNSFVFAAESSNGKFDIFVQRIGGKKALPLTEDSPFDDTQPAFSPDGKFIAFRSERDPSGIYVMEATGENLHRVCDFGFHPSWSPDGKEIAVTEIGRAIPSVRTGMKSGALFRVNIETGAKKELIRNDAIHPSWSPNGKRIAYWFMPAGLGRRDIATISADGGEPVVIEMDSVTNWNPVWSPDGKFLYFVSDKSGNMNFWRVRIDEETGKVLSEPEAVVTPSKFSRHLNFSHDGKRMIYVSTDNKSNIQAVEFDSKNGKTIGTPYWVTTGDREITRAELSPDGTKFLMRLIRRTQDDVIVINRDGTNQHDLTNDVPFDRYPRWSPDGKQVAFASDRNGIYQIFIVNSDGINPRQITFAEENGASFPVWSPDGKRIAFTTRIAPYIMDLTKSCHEQTPQKILVEGEQSRFSIWDWSADGKKLVGSFAIGDSRGLGYYSLETNHFERVVEIYDAIPSWLPDSHHFVYATDDKVFIADIETKKVKEIISLAKEQVRSPFVSRDGHLLYYTIHSSESDIWLLDLTQK